MLVERKTLTPAKRVAEKQGRWARVALSHRGVEATDTFILARAHRTDPIDDAEYPVFPGAPEGLNAGFQHRVVVNAADVIRVAEQLKKVKTTLPAVRCARIMADESKVVAVVTDLQRHETTTLLLPSDQEWPDTDGLLEMQKQPVLVMGVAVSNLSRLAGLMQDCGIQYVQLAITGPETPVYFAGKDSDGALVDGLMMPARGLNDLPTRGAPWKLSGSADEVAAATPVPEVVRTDGSAASVPAAEAVQPAGPQAEVVAPVDPVVQSLAPLDVDDSSDDVLGGDLDEFDQV